MSNFDKGTERILYIRSSGTYFPIGCLTDNSFSESTESLDTTVRTNTDGWSSSVPTRQSYNISFNGLLSLEDLGQSVLTYMDIQALKRSRTKIEWKIFSNLGGDTDTGSGYITDLSNSASIDEFVSFSGEIVGTGLPLVPTIDLIDMIIPYELSKTG